MRVCLSLNVLFEWVCVGVAGACAFIFVPADKLLMAWCAAIEPPHCRPGGIMEANIPSMERLVAAIEVVGGRVAGVPTTPTH